MHFSTTSLFAAAGLLAYANAHMIMKSPVPYGKSSLNNSPLDASGSDFPCKQRPGVYDAQGASNIFPLGSTQTLSFTGSAVHGGGSCQLSITYDKNPTKNSDFRVIHSIEGGCPAKGQSGNLPEGGGGDSDTYPFTIPTDLPTGDATLAWTWFNKVGNREMYMNCAPVSITAPKKVKRSPPVLQRDQSAFEKLPKMFVANIGNGCATTESVDVAFPDPGTSVDKFGTPSALGPPSPAGCGGASGGSSGGSPAPAASPAPSPAVFVPGAASASSAASPPPAMSTTMATKASSSMAAAPTSSAAAMPAVPAPSPAPPSTQGSQTPGSPCQTEGMWNCLPGGKSFQQCASGMWSAVQPMAQGVTCSPGQSTTLQMGAGRVKRSPYHGHRQKPHAAVAGLLS